jgi:DNA-binding transcriptional ArsR family regulator
MTGASIDDRRRSTQWRSLAATGIRITTRPQLHRDRQAARILNHMVQYPQIDRTFGALADPTRRGVLERLGRGSATITELAEPAGISLTGMKKHVRVLEEAQLVTTEKVGRVRRCSLGPRRLDDVHEWIEMYRRMLDERLDRFGELLERTKGEP